MTDETDWYENMAVAMKKRDHAIKMMDKWQVTKREAELDIQDLFTENQNEATYGNPE